MPIHSRQKEDTVPKLIRRLLLAWLLAITLESLLLPTALRNLSGLEGLAKMSLPRVCALTCGGFLLLEAADKLNKVRPASFGQAARISGVNPADLQVLSVWLAKRRYEDRGKRNDD